MRLLHEAAAAKAHLTNIKGSLKDDDNAGFVIEHGKEIAGGTGGGAELYIGMRLKSPKRFFLYASERITEELARDALRVLPPLAPPSGQHPQTGAAHHLYHSLRVGPAGRPPKSGSPQETEALKPSSILSPGRCVERYCLDRMVEAGAKMLGNFLEDLVFRGLSPQIRNLSRSKRGHILAGFPASVAALEAGDLSAASPGAYPVRPGGGADPANAREPNRPVAPAANDHLGHASDWRNAAAAASGRPPAARPAK